MALFFLAHNVPTCCIIYVLLKAANETASRLVKPEPGRVIAITIACVLAVTAGLTGSVLQPKNICQVCSSTNRRDSLPSHLVGAMWLINAPALVMLFFRRRTILDVWLVVTLFASLPDLHCRSCMPSSRYWVFGWYTARPPGGARVDRDDPH